ncbi:MAG: energy transducer TonB [Cystobacterineae bacterium]|nr:energy transducer TonB [Cystobacterineae bacterium]
MFDSILKRNTLPKPQYGVGLCIALAVHAAALLGALWFSTQHVGQTKPLPESTHVEVILYNSLPPSRAQPPIAIEAPPPPPPPPQEKPQPRTSALQKKRMVKPLAIPSEEPPESAPEEMPEQSSALAHPHSEAYGVEGGNPHTHFDPTLHGKPGPIGSPVMEGSAAGVIPFGEGMLRPKLMKNPAEVVYSQEALRARIEGLAVVRCTITVEGNVENCRFIQRLPYMDEAILSYLYMRQYAPSTFQGKPIAVDYNIHIRLKLP